jgi:hypothetical protein
MKRINRIFALLLLTTIVISIVGCAKCISIEHQQVEVTIVDEYHRGAWLQPIIINGKTSFINHPAVWQIIVEYNGINHTISGSDTYNKYKDKIGQTAIGELEIRTYDDGTVKYYIVSLE